MLNCERELEDRGIIRFRINGIPRAKPRQTQRDKFAPSLAVQNYRFWADLVRLAWRENVKGEPWEGGIALGAIFFFPIPQSWPAAKRNEAMVRDLPHIIKPDIDNLLKGISDPLNGLAWRDDCQICRLLEPCEKLWTPQAAAGAWITVERLT